MSEAPIRFHASNGALVARVALDTFQTEAVYAAAFTFIDRAWVRLERPDAQHVDVVLAPKSGEPPAREEVEEALWGARLSVTSADAGRAWVEDIVLRGLGAPAPEPEPLPELGPEDLAAFDDPLGIAKSWEEKHKKP